MLQHERVNSDAETADEAEPTEIVDSDAGTDDEATTTSRHGELLKFIEADIVITSQAIRDKRKKMHLHLPNYHSYHT